MESQSPLSKIPYFRDLTSSELGDVQRASWTATYEKGESLFLEGDECLGLYVVLQGRVRIYKTSAEGREQVLAVMGPGASFNEVPIFDGAPNPASAEALETSRVLVVPKDEMIALLARSPAVAQAVLRVFSQRLRQLTMLVEDLSFRHVSSRVAKTLLEHWAGSREPRLSTLDSGLSTPQWLTQQQMAAMVGSAREVVARALRGMEERGIIRVERGRIQVLDRAGLEEIAWRS